MIQRSHLLLAFFLMFSASSAYSATVTQVKGQQVLIDLEGEEASEGDEFYLVNPETEKKTGLVRIKKSKGAKAIAEIVKGRAASGYSLQAKSGGTKTADSSEESPAETSSSRRGGGGLLRSLKDSYGILGSYIMSTMSADVSSNNGAIKTTADMAGAGFGVGGFYDYAYSSSLVGRGYAAVEQFTATGTASAAACGDSTNCTASINYLSLYGLGKWYPTQGKTRMWLGGGFGYLLALSKSSTALNEAQISTNSVITVAFGLDYQTSRKNYVPISLEYNMFPASETVKASQILLKAGWAWNL